MRAIIVALIIATVVITVSQHAAAGSFQTTVQVHYWGAPLDFGNPAPPTLSDTANTWGVALRLDDRTSRWSFSGRYDAMSVTPMPVPLYRASIWDANVHYRFGSSLNAYVGVLAGYGSVYFTSVMPLQGGGANGLQVGAEFLVRRSSGWYFTGEAIYGPSWPTTIEATPGVPNSNVTALRAAVGYEFPGGWGLEGGWRYVSWKIPPSPTACATPPGCEIRLSGVTAAVTFRR